MKDRNSMAVIFTLLIALWSLPMASAGSERETVTIFAAASTLPAMTAIADQAEPPGELRLVFAATSTLAKQIEAGAPADLFLAANESWMDYLSARDLVVAESRIDLLANRLALIAPITAEGPHEIDWSNPGPIFTTLLNGGRLGIGDPAHVPAGIYAKAALESLGLWSELAPRTAPQADVRGVLTLVERGEVGAGIVYLSDTQGRDRVATIGLVPDRLHPPIRYPLAIVTGRDTPPVRRVYDFLRRPEARTIFIRHGFQPLSPDGG